jgi:hypothetical protein
VGKHQASLLGHCCCISHSIARLHTVLSQTRSQCLHIAYLHSSNGKGRGPLLHTHRRNGGLRAVQLIEHQHGRRRSVVRAHVFPSSCTGDCTDHRQRKHSGAEHNGEPAPEQRRALWRRTATGVGITVRRRTAAGVAATVGRSVWWCGGRQQAHNPGHHRRRTLWCFDGTSPAPRHCPVGRALWRRWPVEALVVVSKGSRDGDTIANCVLVVHQHSKQHRRRPLCSQT